jgi:tetratricopeptide (TPR) repeat protein
MTTATPSEQHAQTVTEKLLLRIFVSSPGDVAAERALSERVFRRLASEFADVVTLDVLLWEHEPIFAHAGFQEQLPRPSQCDLVICILWARLGTRLPVDFAPEPGRPRPTGTEFEVRDALAAYAKFGKPNLLIYRKLAAPHLDMTSANAEERFDQYKRLEEFCHTAFYDAAGAVLVAHHGFTDGADFERRLTEQSRKWIERELARAGQHQARPRWTEGSPFRGLQAFDAEHQDVFFGRSQAVGEIIQRLQDSERAEGTGTPHAHLLLILGMSGNGKTSLVRAGLLPFLADRPVEGIAAWLSTSVRPSDVNAEAPAHGALGAMAAGIRNVLSAAASFALSSAELARTLASEPAAAAARIETYLDAQAATAGLARQQVRLLIYLDQLEELFTLPPVSAHATSILDALVALAALPSVWVIATLRSDFAHRLEAHAALMDLLRRSPPYTLLPPRGDELADMIREPAHAAGLVFEERDGRVLDRELLREAAANPESLPLLEYALQQLYEGRRGRTLLWEVYRPDGRAGGLRGALVTEAERLLAAGSGDSEGVFRRVMRELTSVAEDGSATRRYAPQNCFAAGTAEQAFLERLIQARLAVTDRRGIEPVVCLAHEALLQSWPRAQQWLQQETALLRLRDELQQDAHNWETHARSSGYLGTAAEKLTAIERLEQEGLLPAGPAQEYAERSRGRARRNRLLRQGAIGSICALLILSVIAGFIALQQRNRARAEAATADRTSRFMVDLFKLADPDENRGNSITVREVLDRGASEIGQGLAREPRIRADLLTAMGEAYTGLGLYDPARKLLSQALTDQRGIDVPPESRVRTLIASGVELYLSADYDAAQAQLRQAVALAQKVLPPDSVLTSESRDALADVLVQLEQYDEAERLCLAALAVDRTRGPDGMPLLARTLAMLASTYYFSGALDKAEAPMREALRLRKQYLGLRHPSTAVSMNDLGSLLYQEGRYAQAAAQWREALPVYREVYGAEHPEMATLLNNLGRSALMAGQVDEAIPLLGQAMQMTEKLQGPTHDDLVPPLNSLGMAYLYKGDLQQARQDIGRALQIARLRKHQLLDQVVLNQADIDLADGRAADAGPLLSEARALLEARYPPGKDPSTQWRYAVWESVNANLLALQQHPAEAQAAFAHARAELVKRFGADGFYVRRLEQRAAGVNLMARSSAAQ